MDYVDIPCAILDMHSGVTLVAGVMFVNGIPFLVSASCNINLITIEHAPYCTAAKLSYLLECIVRIYAKTGFTIQTILMDNEFEKVKVNIPMVNLKILITCCGGAHRRNRVSHSDNQRAILGNHLHPSIPQATPTNVNSLSPLHCHVVK